MWRFGGLSSLHDCLVDATRSTPRDKRSTEALEPASRDLQTQTQILSPSSDDSEQGLRLEPDVFQSMLRDVAHYALQDFARIVTSGGTAHSGLFMGPKLEQVQIPQQWVWNPKCSDLCLKDGLTTAKLRYGISSGCAIGSRGFSSGVHSWVLRARCRSHSYAVGVCTTDVIIQSFRIEGGIWSWQRSGRASGPNKHSKVFPDFSHGDSIRLVLDMNRGTLAFYRNGERAGALENVSETVYPCVLMHDKDDEVTVVSAWTALQEEASAHPMQDMARACTRMMRNTVSLVTSMMQSADMLTVAQQDMCVHVMVIELEKFCQLCKMLIEQGGKLPHASVLALLDCATQTQTQADTDADHALGSNMGQWLLACLKRIQDSRCQGRLLPRMAAAVQSGMELVHACPYLRCYQGAAMHAYALRGWHFLSTVEHNTARHLRIDHSAALDGNWTLEFVLICTREKKPQGRMLLAATRDFCIVLAGGNLVQFEKWEDGPSSFEQRDGPFGQGDESDSEGAQERRILSSEERRSLGMEGGNNPGSGQRYDRDETTHKRTSVSPVKCPLNRWVLLSFVCTGDATSVFVDGRRVGSIKETFALSLQTIGACPQARNPQADTFEGQVRECRVYTVARSGEDMLR